MRFNEIIIKSFSVINKMFIKILIIFIKKNMNTYINFFISFFSSLKSLIYFSISKTIHDVSVIIFLSINSIIDRFIFLPNPKSSAHIDKYLSI